MGDVLNMPVPRARVAGTPPAGGADILFFTGVRYERMSEAPAARGEPEDRGTDSNGNGARSGRRRLRPPAG